MHSVWPSWHPFVPRMVSGSPGNFFFFPPIIKQKLFAFYLGEGRCCSIFTGGNNDEYGNWCFKICSEKKWLLRGVNVDGGCFVLVWFFVFVFSTATLYRFKMCYTEIHCTHCILLKDEGSCPGVCHSNAFGSSWKNTWKESKISSLFSFLDLHLLVMQFLRTEVIKTS